MATNVFKKLSSGIHFKKNKPSQTSETKNTKEYIESISRISLKQSVSSQSSDNVDKTKNDNSLESTVNSDDYVDISHLKIKFMGDDLPFSSEDVHSLYESFDSFGLKEWILRNIREHMAWSSPTPIQKASIPVIMNDRDIIVSSPTGSGKTGAYLIPVLQMLKPQKKMKDQKTAAPHSIILTPTKELATQVYLQLKKLSEGKPYKIGVLTKDKSKNSDSNRRYDIVITTPSKLLYTQQQGLIDLTRVELLVLDEVDRLLNEDFIRKIDNLISECSHPKRRIAMFTATLLPVVEQLANTVLKNPIRAVVGTRNVVVENVTQKLTYVGSEDGKLLEIRNMIRSGIDPPIIIFVQSKERASQLFHELIFDNLSVGVITGDNSEAHRKKTIESFRTGSIWVLIATDVLSRGIDLKAVSTVINYDTPNSATAYVHRVGRTGRMGRKGTAITFFTDADTPFIKPIINVMVNSGQSENIPHWMHSIKNLDSKTKRNMSKKAIEREDIDPILRNEKRIEKERNEKKRKRVTKGGKPKSNKKLKNKAIE